MKDVFKFSYNGYTFVPVGQIDPKMTLKKASLYLESAFIGLSKYDHDNQKGWSYNEFYNAATSKCDTCDVFYCEETGKYYIPCENELMVWNGDFVRIKVTS